MFKPIIIMVKSIASVVRWINIDTFHLAGELLLYGFQGEEVIAVDEYVVEDVLAIAPPRRGMVRLRGILNQHTRFKPRPLVLANPSQFKLLEFRAHLICSPLHRC